MIKPSITPRPSQSGICYICHHTSFGYDIWFIRDLKSTPVPQHICNDCIRTKEFWFYDKETNCVRFNLVTINASSTLSIKIGRTDE
jgi:hypothetical protein